MLLVSEKRLEANEQKILHTTKDLGIVFLKFLSDFFRAEESFKSSIKLVEEMRDILQDKDEWKISFRGQNKLYTNL